RLGKVLEARASFERILQIDPRHLAGQINLANIQIDMGNAECARAMLTKVVDDYPGSATAWDGLGRAWLALSVVTEAIDAFIRACSIETANPNFFSNLANALNRAERYDEALIACHQGLDVAPTHVGLLINAGNTWKGKGDWEQARQCYERASAVDPLNPDVFELIGFCHLKAKAYERAAASYERSLKLRPNCADAWAHRGLSLAGMARFDEAEQAFRQALEADADCEVALIGLPAALRDQHRWAEALDAHARARRLVPGSAEAIYNQSLCQLASGDFSSGWSGYEARWRLPEFSVADASAGMRRWLGDWDLRESMIVLSAEQGLGDVIQFMRFVPDVAARAGSVVVRLPASLTALTWSKLPSNVSIISTDEPQPTAAWHCPLMSLPLALGYSEAAFHSEAYIEPDPVRIASWRERLGARQRLRVGLVVSGNARHAADRFRSIALQTVLTDAPAELDWVVLQKEIRASDRMAPVFANCRVFDDHLVGFEDTAALASCMDLVISVDTSVAHLCGAMGIPTWVLLAYNADWRWQTERADSPWYSSVRLFRQKRIGDWSGVLHEVWAALEAYRASQMSDRRAGDQALLSQPV
ncbi:MAG: tetratricopeptide repeat protein, partial [Betaproteobacteria bacterium]